MLQKSCKASKLLYLVFSLLQNAFSSLTLQKEKFENGVPHAKNKIYMDSPQRKGIAVERVLVGLLFLSLVFFNTDVLRQRTFPSSNPTHTIDDPSASSQQCVTKPILPPLPLSVTLPHNGGNCRIDANVTIDDMIRFVEDGHPVLIVGPKRIGKVVPGYPFSHGPSVLPLIPKEIWLMYCTAMTAFKTTVTGGAQSTFPAVIDGSAWPPYPAMSMSGYRRLNNAELLVADVIARGIPGDVIETGVWRGGLSALMTAVVAWLDPSRKVFLADSFKGIPNQGPNATHFLDRVAHRFDVLNDNSVEEVKQSFERLGLLSTGIPRFLVGYFNDTLGPAAARGDFDKGFAVVRLDGDTYLSTMQAMTVLYPRLAVGGYVIVDDYTSWPGCRAAITDYRAKYDIVDVIVPVHHERKEEVQGVFWRKTKVTPRE